MTRDSQFVLYRFLAVNVFRAFATPVSFYLFVAFLSSLLELILLIVTGVFFGSLVGSPSIGEFNPTKYLHFFHIFVSNLNVFYALLLATVSILSTLARVYNLYFCSYLSAQISSFLVSFFVSSLANKNYSYFVKSDLSTVLARVNSATGLSDAIITPILSSISNVFTFLFIFCGLIFISPIPTLFLLSTGFLFYFTVGSFSKRKLEFISRTTGDYSKKINASASYIFMNIKEISIGGLVRTTVTAFSRMDLTLRNTAAKATVLLVSPKIFLEGIGFLLLSLTAFFLHLSSNGSSDFLSVIAFMALGLQRLLPSFQQFYNSAMGLKRNVYILDMLFGDNLFSDGCPDFFPPSPSSLSFSALVFPSHSNDLHTRTGRHIQLAKSLVLNLASMQDFNIPFTLNLSDLSIGYTNEKPLLFISSLTLRAPSVVLIKGASGSGKSTLLNTILGLIPPITGSLSYRLNYENVGLSSLTSEICYVPQDPYFCSQSLLHYLLGPDFIDCKLSSEYFFSSVPGLRSFVENVCSGCLLASLIDRLPNRYDYIISEGATEFSGGQRQRLSLAKTLIQSKRLTILDESLSAIDPPSRKLLLTQLKSCLPSSLVLIVSHHNSTSSFCDRVIDTADFIHPMPTH